MNYKLFLMLFIMIIIIGNVSALIGFDTIKSYDDSSKTITLKNSFLFIPTSKIVDITLDTPQVYYVSAGYNKVAQFTINPNEDIDSVLGSLKMYDIKDRMKPIERQIDLKYLTIEQVSVNDYKNVLSKNGSMVGEVIGSHLKDKEVWSDFTGNVKSDVPITIGLFTIVEVGDRVEWIPTINGVKINEWAIWATAWQPDRAINASLPDFTNYAAPSVFNMSGAFGDNKLYMISGLTDGKFYGFKWNGTDWNANSSINASLPDIGDVSTPFVFYKDSTWYIISGEDSGGFFGFKWNGTQWLTNATINASLPSVGLYSRLSVFQKDSTWYLISGEGSGGFFGFKWDGTQWLTNATINASLPDIGDESMPSVFYKDSTWYMISGEAAGTFFGFNYTGTVWQTDLVINASLPDIGDWGTPSIFNRSDGTWYMISGAADGKFYGFNRTELQTPLITLINPTDGKTFLTNSITIATLPYSPIDITNINVTIYTNQTGNWLPLFINASAYNNTQTNYTNTFSNGIYEIGVSVNDSTTYGVFSTNITILVTSSIINNIYWNVSTSETTNETFTANITTNGTTISNAWLNYNGTNYLANVLNTNGNDYNISKFIDIPIGYGGLNRTFNFTYTLGGTNYSTINNTQNVSLLNFTLCDSINNNDFLNLSFKDEVSNSYINASIPSLTFTYYLGSGLLNKTLSYVNNTNNYNYTFCGVPTTSSIKVLPNLQYKQGTTYPQRIWQPILQNYNSSIFNQILYLLSSSDGIFVTFQVTNLAGEVINGVDVNVTKTSDGSLISSGVTDSAGLVTFFLNPDIQQTIGFSKTGYTTYITSLFPTQSSYSITLGSTSTTTDNYNQGISKLVTPSSGFLDENTTYNFSYTISSSFWTLDSFTFSLYYGNNTLIGTNTSASNGGTLYLFNINTTNQTYVYMNYSYLINGNYSNFTRNWIIQSTSGRGYSIWHFFTDLNLYIDSANGLLGIDDFGKLIIALGIIIFSVGLVSTRYGINNEAGIMVILFALVFLLDYGLNFIPQIQIGNLHTFPHFVSALAFILTIVTIFREENR